MLKLVQFLRKIYVLLLFVLLESICLHYYAGSTSYTRSRLVAASNSVLGGMREGISHVGSYFTMTRQNRELTDQVALLRNRLAMYESDPAIHLPAPGEIAAYQHQTARVIGNSVSGQNNFFTLNRGMRDDVEANMAVITPDGCIAGYVLSCSEKFAACMSVLNREFRTSGKFKRAEYTGLVSWDGVSQQYVVLSEIPKYAEIVRGDTIVTSDYSFYFPPGLMIGTVEDWTLDDQTYSYNIRVKLAPRLGSMRDVVLVRYMDATERAELEHSDGYHLND